MARRLKYLVCTSCAWTARTSPKRGALLVVSTEFCSDYSCDALRGGHLGPPQRGCWERRQSRRHGVSKDQDTRTQHVKHDIAYQRFCIAIDLLWAFLSNALGAAL